MSPSKPQIYGNTILNYNDIAVSPVQARNPAATDY
jgi:hypothetical protein